MTKKNDGDAGEEKPEDGHSHDGTVVSIREGNNPARDVLGRDTSRHKLTSQQQGFVNSVLAGANQSDAYRANYDTSRMSDKSVWELSSRLFANVKVGSRIEQGRRAQERVAVHTGASLRSHIERELFELSTKADTDAARLRALELLGKTEKCGIFVERTADVTETMTAEELQAELETKLRAYLGESP
jgi:hypothetical protein